MLRYRRILLKLSGESLMGSQGYGIDPVQLQVYCEEILEVSQLGVEVGIVIGGGNIFRGLKGVDKGFDRVKGDTMGMLATVINSIALESMFESLGGKARVLTAVEMGPVGERFSKNKALELFQKGYIVICSGGTGNPFFTTDTAAVLRAVEIEADVMLKGTRVDGIYSADPEKNPNAKRYEQITYDEALEKNLNVMDQTAFALSRDNRLPIVVFDMNTKGNLKKVISGENIGTIVKIK
ncbi:MAG: UMP kinase [Bacteroidales bacterium]